MIKLRCPFTRRFVSVRHGYLQLVPFNMAQRFASLDEAAKILAGRGLSMSGYVSVPATSE